MQQSYPRRQAPIMGRLLICWGNIGLPVSHHLLNLCDQIHQGAVKAKALQIFFHPEQQLQPVCSWNRKVFNTHTDGGSKDTYGERRPQPKSVTCCPCCWSAHVLGVPDHFCLSSWAKAWGRGQRLSARIECWEVGAGGGPGWGKERQELQGSK